MGVQRVSSRTLGIGTALVIGFLVLASAGVWFIMQRGLGLVYELAYVLLLLIALVIIADQLFVR